MNISEIKIMNNDNKDIFQEIVKWSPVPFFGLNEKLLCTFINNEAAKLSNRSIDDLIGKKIIHIFPGIEKTLFSKSYIRVLNSRKPETIVDEFIFPDGRKRWYEATVVPYKNGIFCIITDITKRKKAEQKLKDSEEKYRRLIEETIVGVWVIDSNYNTTFVNQPMANILGYNREEMIGESIFSFIDEENRNRAIEILQNQEKKGINIDTEFKLTRKNGNFIVIQLRASPIFDKNNLFKGAFAFIVDITERMEVKEKLKESEEKFKYIANELEMILDHIPGLIFFKDAENNFIRVNKYHADCHKLSKKEFEGVNCFDIYPKEQAQAYWEDDLEVINTKKPKFNIIEPWDTPEGKRWVITSKIPYINGEGKVTGIIGFANDITERMKVKEKLKESEAKYRHAYEQAEFYKDLFAHDISNILQIMKSSLDLLSMWHNEPDKIDKVKEIMNIVDDQIVRGSKLVANIRKISQISETKDLFKPVDGIQILKDAINFIHKSFHEKDLKIEVYSQIETAKVQANGLLMDVFENILINAIKHNDNQKVEILVRISKEFKENIKYVKFEFNDNGIGVPDVLKEYIFKGISHRIEKQHGMGLGLLLVKRAITSFKGEIWVEDKVKDDSSKGSNFIILIPEVV